MGKDLATEGVYVDVPGWNQRWEGCSEGFSSSGYLLEFLIERCKSFFLDVCYWESKKGFEHNIRDITWFEGGNKTKCFLHEGCTLTDLREERCFLSGSD